MTLRTMDSRNGLTRHVVTSTSDFDLDALAGLMEESWASDYADKIRIDFNKTHLHHMMEGGEWFALLICDDAGHPVGFEIAMERTLLCHGRPSKTFVVTAFTVSSKQRRRGIGRWLLEGINQVAFEERDAKFLISSFHHGAAGSPTVQATFDQIEGFGVNRFHTFPSWGRRIDKQPLPPIEGDAAVARLQQRDHTPDWVAISDNESGNKAPPPSVPAFTEALSHRYDVAYSPTQSFREYYLRADSPEAGALWYDFGDGATCFVSYALTPLIVNQRPLRPTGLIQAVHAENCRPIHLEQLLVRLAHRFLAQGCFAMTLYDLGIFPHDVLRKVGLQSDDQFDYAIRGPVEAIEQFSRVEVPFFLDFT